ncbi:MAG: energy-coupling factor ABC transporter permease [Nitrospinae bacterium]|nr:energy-coupling factor ABC transporter permease [Nitrospinota bacterium]
MHVPDGFMSPEVNAAAFAISLAACGVAFNRGGEDDNRLAPLMGVTSAFVFAGQMINFPVAPGTSGHFLGAAFATALLGPSKALVAMCVTLILQLLLFADGGVTAIGTNIFNMGVVACGTAYLSSALLSKLLPSSGRWPLFTSALSAWLSVTVSSAALALELALSGTSPIGAAFPAIVGVHSIIGVGEALLTASALSVVLAARPDIVRGIQQRSAPAVMEA